jgi:hypothetical protein
VKKKVSAAQGKSETAMWIIGAVAILIGIGVGVWFYFAGDKDDQN